MPPFKITQTDPGPEIDRAIALNGLDWTAGNGSQFVIVPQPGSEIKQDPKEEPDGICAYHSYYSSKVNGYEYYDVVPVQSGSACLDVGDGNAVATLQYDLSHEYAETATDPYVGTGWTDGLPKDNEVADMCVYPAESIDGVSVTPLWSNEDTGPATTLAEAAAVGQRFIVTNLPLLPRYSYIQIGNGPSNFANVKSIGRLSGNGKLFWKLNLNKPLTNSFPVGTIVTVLGGCVTSD